MFVISDSRLNTAKACVYLCHQCTNLWLRWIRSLGRGFARWYVSYAKTFW